MDRNNKLLKILFTSVGLATLVNCFNEKKNEDDAIYDSDTKFLSLSKAIGKYYFVPIKDEYRDEYKVFNLKKGDSVFLEIKPDSSFVFSHFYYNIERGDKMIGTIENYKGIIEENLDDKSKIFFPFPENKYTGVQGFLLSKKDTIFYYRLSIENNLNNAYRIFFKKMKHE